MKKAVLRGLVVILSVALLLCGILSAVIFSMRQTDAKAEELSRIVRIIAGQFNPESDQNRQANEFAVMLNGIRVTIIDAGGTVTGDSAADFAAMENHLNRAEIMEARGTKAAVSIRRSSTIDKTLMYAVMKTPDGNFVRLAEEYGGILSGLVSFIPAAALAAFLSLIVAFFLANRFSKSVTEPIIAMNDSLVGVKNGSVTLNPDDYPYEELRDMALQINALASDIGTHMNRLSDERNKVSFILDNISEGFVLMDGNQNILLINNSACSYMRCDKNVIGHEVSHCTQNYDFLQTADDVARCRMNKAIDVILDGKVIETDFMVVSGQNDMSGNIIITMTDVTAKRDAVKLRRDFFTNASHELRTPITSIKGSVELLCADISLEDNQREELLARIGIETERMYSLINDIIMINRLESGELTGEKENLDLSAVICDCCDEIKPLADQMGINIKAVLEPVELYADHKNTYEMISNLVMNAVKYNKQGGRVDVCLKTEETGVILTVRNDGEIILPEHRHRVFERFYRVDKGRSKTVGGTGLGLSIVKHVLDTLGGTIRLESNEKNGTAFTVKIPMQDDQVQ